MIEILIENSYWDSSKYSNAFDMTDFVILGYSFERLAISRNTKGTYTFSFNIIRAKDSYFSILDVLRL